MNLNKNINIQQLPLLEPGKRITAKIVKASFVALNLEILTIDGIHSIIPYKAIYKPNELEMKYDCDIIYKKDEIYEARVISLSDRDGVLVNDLTKIGNK